MVKCSATSSVSSNDNILFVLDYKTIINEYYPEGTTLRDILIVHSRRVADKALAIHRSLQPQHEADASTIEAAAMLHDIGIFLCDAAGIECYGTEPYICHGTLGAKLLRANAHRWGYTAESIEPFARVCERHTGAGLTAADITRQNLPLPAQNLLPETYLEKLICYADKFFSKTHPDREKPLDRVLLSMQKFGSDSYERFLLLHQQFTH